MYVYSLNNPIKYSDPDGRIANIIIGATVGFVSSACSEIGGRLASGQSLSEATKNTFTSGESWAVIGAATAIGALTSGLSGAATSAVTSSAKSVISIAAKEGGKEIAKNVAKTIAINTVSGAVDAGLKDVTTKAIKGESQNAPDTIKKIGSGAATALMFAAPTEAIIGAGVKTSGTIENVLTGTLKDFKIYQPEWAGSAGNIGENIIPTMLDCYNSLFGEQE